MITVRVLFHLARADFLERVRRSSFLITLAVTAFMGYLFVPPLDADYQTITLGNARGLYNSAWIGAMFGLMVSMAVSIFAFYLVNNAIWRDRKTRVGEIIASTPVNKLLYVLGKWLSNIAVLVLVLVVLTVVAVGMQLFRAEDLHIDFWALFIPIWLVGLPVLAAVAAVAVLFESIPFLSRGFGNVVYFFLWTAVFSASIIIKMANIDGGMVESYNDFFGVTRTIADMQATIVNYDLDYTGSFSIGANVGFENPLIFRWHGLRWTSVFVWERLSWVLIALGFAMIAALPFDRFDTSRLQIARIRKRRTWWRGKRADHLDRDYLPSKAESQSSATTLMTLFPDLQLHWGFFVLLRSELHLMLRGQPWWWYLIAAGLVISSAVTPPNVATIILAFAWLWPILVWSPMGAREMQYYTNELVFSTPHLIRRQLAVIWLSGVLVSLLVASGGLIHALVNYEGARALVMLAGVIFVPSLALALGVWSCNTRLFEIVYLLIWYIAFNGVPALDFMGLNLVGEPLDRGVFYLAMSVALLVVSVFGRRRYLQRK